MTLLYVLFSKFVPIISIWELKAGQHERSGVTLEEEEQEARGLSGARP